MRAAPRTYYIFCKSFFFLRQEATFLPVLLARGGGGGGSRTRKILCTGINGRQFTQRVLCAIPFFLQHSSKDFAFKGVEKFQQHLNDFKKYTKMNSKGK